MNVTKPQQPELARSGHSAATEASAKSAPKTRPKTGGRAGKVPPANRPGHHPDHEQDKPDGSPPVPAPPPAPAAERPPIPQRPALPEVPQPELATAQRPRTGRRFRFAFDGVVGVAASALRATPSRAFVEVGPRDLVVQFGIWSLRTPLDNVAGAIVTGPFSWPRVIGPPHISLADRGLTFATNTRRGVCIHFHRPVRALMPVGPLRHPSITVTVDDPEGLAHCISS